ncbi:MAG: tyrosine-type recombinase/integrase [Dehalococcoidia bacterium]|nr:tyrosine-type recombinase/integrase [Dehalococcoidia bacterium]
MGKPLATTLAQLPPEHLTLLKDYEDALRRAGISDRIFASKARSSAQEGAGASVLGNRLWAARRFLAEWDLTGWRALSAADQLALLIGPRPAILAPGYRSFICWLGLTGRAPFSASLLETLDARAPSAIRWLEQGRLVWPDFFQRLRETALKLGYQPDTGDFVCHAVTKAVAHTGKQPETLTTEDLVAVSEAILQVRRRNRNGQPPRSREHQPLRPWTTASVLYHAGVIDSAPDTHLIGRRPGLGDEVSQLGFLQERWPELHDVARRYLERRRASVKPSTIKQQAAALGSFLRWLTSTHPEISSLSQLDRMTHIEPYIGWVLHEGGRGRACGERQWTLSTRHARLSTLRSCFRLLTLWGWPEAPARQLFLSGDLPRLPDPLPKAFDDVQAASMVHLARTTSPPLQRLIIELLAGCGLRVGEARDLKLSDIVSFGSTASHPATQPWLRVPLGKLGNDRYVPIGPELQEALDHFLEQGRSGRDWEGLASPPAWTAYLLTTKGRRVSRAYCNQVVHQLARRAGVIDAHAHRWRHTFATQAINRGMDLASIAALLGHTTLEMTMVYARIANPSLRREFDRVSQQVQAFYSVVSNDTPSSDTPVQLPAGALGPAMTVTRRELEWRRLGNGWCTRRAYIDCRYELVCERCVHFNTDQLFLPVLESQYEDASRKGQHARIELFGELISSVKQAQDMDSLPAVSGPQLADFSAPNAQDVKP